MRKTCARTFSEAPPQYCAQIVQVHPRTNFAQSQHIFGCPCTSLTQIFWDLSGIPRAQVLHNFFGHMACSQNLPLYRQWMSQPYACKTAFVCWDASHIIADLVACGRRCLGRPRLGMVLMTLFCDGMTWWNQMLPEPRLVCDIVVDCVWLSPKAWPNVNNYNHLRHQRLQDLSVSCFHLFPQRSLQGVCVYVRKRSLRMALQKIPTWGTNHHAWVWGIDQWKAGCVHASASLWLGRMNRANLGGGWASNLIDFQNLGFWNWGSWASSAMSSLLLVSMPSGSTPYTPTKAEQSLDWGTDGKDVPRGLAKLGVGLGHETQTRVPFLQTRFSMPRFMSNRGSELLCHRRMLLGVQLPSSSSNDQKLSQVTQQLHGKCPSLFLEYTL